MTNGYTGKVPLILENKTYTLFFDWEAIAEIRTVFGKLITNIYTAEPSEIAGLVAIGLKRLHPEAGWTQEKIIKLAPPLFPILESLDTALAYSYFGIDKKPAKETEAPAKANGTKKPSAKKKTK